MIQNNSYINLNVKIKTNPFLLIQLKKKIFVYVGSNYTESTELKYIKELLKIVESKVDVEYDIVTPRNSNIKYCLGCANCFSNGFCPLDKQDDAQDIKNKILNADFIVFSSPVYMHNVSGNFKNFIDRTCYWCHLFKLLGKPSMSIVSTYTNGAEKVIDILKQYMDSLGLICVGNIVLNLLNNHFDDSIDEYANDIVKALNKEIKLETTQKMEALYTVEKMMFKSYPKDHAEYIYWNDKGLFEHTSLQDIIEKEKKVLIQ